MNKKILANHHGSSRCRLKLIAHGFIYQQENDPKHISKLCTNYVKKESGELELLDWPSLSPNLKNIEQI